MDPAEENSLQQPEQEPPINPESQKASKKLSISIQNRLNLDPIPENWRYENESQKVSEQLSQSGSQMDEQIMQGMTKRQKRRYSSFLEALGIESKPIHTLKQEQANFVQNESNYAPNEPNLQQFKSQTIDNIQNSGPSLTNGTQNHRQSHNSQNIDNPYANVLVNERQESTNMKVEQNSISFDDLKLQSSLSPIYQLNQFQDRSMIEQSTSDHLLRQGLEIDSVGQRQQQNDLGLSTDRNQNFLHQNRQQNQQNNQDYQDHETYQNNQVHQLQQEPIIEAKPQTPQPIDEPYQNHHIQIQTDQPQFTSHISSPHQTPNQQTHNHSIQIQIEGHFTHFQQNQEAVEKLPSEDGEIFVDQNSNPFHQPQQISEIDYDLIRGIYTPVSEYKFARNDVQQLSGLNLETDSRGVGNSEANNLVLSLEEELRVITEDQKDFEIDGPLVLNLVNTDKEEVIHTPYSPWLQQNQHNQQNNEDREHQQVLNEHQSYPKMEIETNQIRNITIPNDQTYQISPKTNPRNQPNNSQQHREQNNFPSISIQQCQQPARTHSQTYEKFTSSGFPKSKKNSFSMALQNSDVVKTADGHANKRKLSDSYRSAGLTNFNNKISSSKKSKDFSNPNHQSFLLSQFNFDSKEAPSFQDSGSNMLQVEEKPQLESIKMTPNGNNFSNRSEKSNKSKRSNRFSDDDINEKQVPQLQSLQLVKDSKEPRLQRRSRSSDQSSQSRHSRSASTCKKSYDDLSQIHMEKIQQKAYEEFDERSVKRKFNPSYPVLQLHEIENEKIEVENQIAGEEESRSVVYVPCIEVQIEDNLENKFNQSADFEKKSTCQVQNSYNEPLLVPQTQNKTQNFKQTLEYQISYNFQQQKPQFFSVQPSQQSKSIQCDNISQNSSKKSSASQEIKRIGEILQAEKQLKMEKLIHVNVYEIVIENPLPLNERLENVLTQCQQFLENAPHHSSYEKQKFKELLETNFEFFGFELEPQTDLGQRLLHDGVFACSFISFVKGIKNSGMIESLMFAQFDEEVGIKTNKESFMKEIKRVKEERQMLYDNEFKIRLKEYEERKSKQEAQKMRMAQKVINQSYINPSHTKDIQRGERQKQIYDEPIQKTIQPIKSSNVRSHSPKIIFEESNTSIAGSSETMTVDERINNSDRIIRIQSISQLSQSVNENGSELTHDGGSLIISNQNHLPTVSVQQDKTVQPKKSDKLKKRVTKKKQKKIESVLLIEVKSQQQSRSSTSRRDKVGFQSKPTSDINILDVETEKDSKGPHEKNKQTKGILKSSHMRKDKDQSSNKEKREHKSPQYSKTQMVSRTKKDLKSRQKDGEWSHQKEKNQRKSRVKKPRKVSTDIDESVQSETKSPRHKISLQKIVNDKANQRRNVKFAQQTRGGESASNNQSRKNSKMNNEQKDSKTHESRPEKRALRSRSKK